MAAGASVPGFESRLCVLALGPRKSFLTSCSLVSSSAKWNQHSYLPHRAIGRTNRINRPEALREAPGAQRVLVKWGCTLGAMWAPQNHHTRPMQLNL